MVLGEDPSQNPDRKVEKEFVINFFSGLDDPQERRDQVFFVFGAQLCNVKRSLGSVDEDPFDVREEVHQWVSRELEFGYHQEEHFQDLVELEAVDHCSLFLGVFFQELDEGLWLVVGVETIDWEVVVRGF